MKLVIHLISKAKNICNIVLRTYNNPKTPNEWREWHNTEQWIGFSNKWFAFLEWVTILSLIEFVNIKTNVWQIRVLTGVSWFIFYSYINSTVINLLSRFASKFNSITIIAVFASSLITWELYEALRVVVATISISN